MEKIFSGIFGRAKRLSDTYQNLFMFNYIRQANDCIPMLSKTRHMALGLNYAQRSNTPSLQNSDSILLIEPVNCSLSLKTRY